MLHHIWNGRLRAFDVVDLRWKPAVREVLLHEVLVVSLLVSVRHVVFGDPSSKKTTLCLACTVDIHRKGTAQYSVDRVIS